MPNSIDFSTQIAQELNLATHHVANVIRLFDEGATIPFIARYRKEMTGTMNEENVAANSPNCKNAKKASSPPSASRRNSRPNWSKGY